MSPYFQAKQLSLRSALEINLNRNTESEQWPMSIHLDFGRKIPRGQTNILARSLFRVIASDDAKSELRTLSYAAFLHHIDGEQLVPVSERSLYRYLGRAFIRHAISWWCHTRVLTRLSTDHRLRLCCYSECSDDARHARQGLLGCWLLSAYS